MTSAVDQSNVRTESQPARNSSAPPEGGQTRNIMSMADFFSAFGKVAVEGGPSWLAEKRTKAAARAVELGFPTTHDEEWRFTRITPLLNLPLHPARTPGRRLTGEEIAPFTFGLDCNRLVFVDGRFCAELSSLPAKESGIQAGSLRERLGGHANELEGFLAACADDSDNAFTALNTAFFQDGAFISVAANKIIEQPVHLLFIATSGEAGATTHVRNLILADAGSDVKVLETYVSLTDAAYFTNTVTELVVGAGAHIEHCKIQEENRRAVHVAAIQGRQAKDSRWTSHSIATGAHVARNQIQTLFNAPGGVCVLNGLFLGRADQLVDHHTVVDHAQPQCESHEYYHGILSGRAHGVFNGKIFVRPHAQKTNAKQTNRNLVLSDEAVIDTKPQLEIFADDVKCTHGATVGQIDDEAIFYLRSRGIGLEHARQIMVRAFASDVVERIPLEPVRAHLNQMLTERFKDKVS